MNTDHTSKDHLMHPTVQMLKDTLHELNIRELIHIMDLLEVEYVNRQAVAGGWVDRMEDCHE